MGKRSASIALLCACSSSPSKSTDASTLDAPIGTLRANRMFVTFNSFPPDILTGAADADRHCGDYARIAGFSGSFVAWYSVPDSPVYLRLAGSRGWVRPDDKPFADTLDDLRAGTIFYPPRITEHTTDIGNTPDLEVATGTHADGSAATNECPSSGTVTRGRLDAGTSAWTDDSTSGCGNTDNLYCFEIGNAVAVAPPPIPSGGHHIFVTAATWPVAGGRAAADQACASEASADGLSGTFHALIASAAGTALAPFTAEIPGHWYRPDGVEVTQDFQSFTAPISQTASGSYLAVRVWAGAPDVMSAATTSCSDWTVTTGMARAGNSSRSRTDQVFGGLAGSDSCASTKNHLYCAD